MSKIDSFSGEYRFLSNFYPCQVTLDNETYPSVEHAYQAAKTLDMEERTVLRTTGPANIVKKLGRRVTVRSDWESVKIEIMSDLVWQKFSNNTELKNKLLDTGNCELVEGNWWNDTFWGVCNGSGHNYLGQILMAVRNELKNFHM